MFRTSQPIPSSSRERAVLHDRRVSGEAELAASAGGTCGGLLPSRPRRPAGPVHRCGPMDWSRPDGCDRAALGRRSGRKELALGADAFCLAPTSTGPGVPVAALGDGKGCTRRPSPHALDGRTVLGRRDDGRTGRGRCGDDGARDGPHRSSAPVGGLEHGCDGRGRRGARHARPGGGTRRSLDARSRPGRPVGDGTRGQGRPGPSRGTLGPGHDSLARSPCSAVPTTPEWEMARIC